MYHNSRTIVLNDPKPQPEHKKRHQIHLNSLDKKFKVGENTLSGAIEGGDSGML